MFETERTLDLTEHREALSLGAYTVPALVADDTFVVASPHNGTLNNGTQVQLDPDDPGFAAELTRDGQLRRVGLSVDRHRSGFGVGPTGSVDTETTPAVEYAVDVDGRIRNGESVTVSVTRTAIASPTTRSRSVLTGSDGSATVAVENARVFETEVPANGTTT